MCDCRFALRVSPMFPPIASVAVSIRRRSINQGFDGRSRVSLVERCTCGIVRFTGVVGAAARGINETALPVDVRALARHLLPYHETTTHAGGKRMRKTLPICLVILMA